MSEKLSKIVLPIKNESTGVILNKEFEVGGENNYGCGYTEVENGIKFINNTSGKIMFELYGVLTLKDDILTFDGYKIDKTSDFPSGGMVFYYVGDIASSFTELSNYEWDTDWITENNGKYLNVDRYGNSFIGWCEIFSETVYTPMEYVSGNGLKIRLTHYGSFTGERIKVDFLHLSAKIKPRTT